MSDPARRPRLTVDIDPDIRRRLKIAAAQHDVTVREYVLAAVERALQAEDQQEWDRLSEPAFARDWDSEDDAVYDAI